MSGEKPNVPGISSSEIPESGTPVQEDKSEENPLKESEQKDPDEDSDMNVKNVQASVAGTDWDSLKEAVAAELQRQEAEQERQ